IESDDRAPVGVVRRRRAASAHRSDRAQASGYARRHRVRRPVLRVRVRRLDYRTGAADRRWQVSAVERVLAHLHAQHDRILARLVEFTSTASVSTDPAHASDVQRAARWVADEASAAGPLDVRMLPTAGNPVVYGEWLGAPGAPTVLVYGHYDV